MTVLKNIPDVEKRFLQPPNWRWEALKTPNGRSLRYGMVLPENGTPEKIVICLHGLTEFAEKYFETARDCLSQNLGFIVLDWMGHGKSDRPLSNPHKIHSDGFQSNVDDLHQLVCEVAAPLSERTGAPLSMLAHSMGGNIGLHYLAQHPDMFESAAFTAPMIGIIPLNMLPKMSSFMLTFALNALMGTHKFPYGVRPHPDSIIGKNIFAGDPLRGTLHRAWVKADPTLKVGHFTPGWLHHAHKFCLQLQKPETLAHIKTPCVIALAGQDSLVSNSTIRKAAGHIPHCTLLEFPRAKHELFMERDETRSVLMTAVFEHIRNPGIRADVSLEPYGETRHAVGCQPATS